MVGQGDSLDEALADVTSAIQFHLDIFCGQAMETESPVLDVVVAEAGVEG